MASLREAKGFRRDAETSRKEIAALTWVRINGFMTESAPIEPPALTNLKNARALIVAGLEVNALSSVRHWFIRVIC